MNNDYETLKYNYVALKKIHIIANNVNEKLSENNDKLKNDILILKDQNKVLNEAIIIKQQLITNSYTMMNELKENYNKLVAGLQEKILNYEK